MFEKKVVECIHMEGFKVNGEVDWKAYRKAQLENGERCSKCDNIIFWHKGYESLCMECEDIDKPGELHHSDFIRCPRCGSLEDVQYSEQYELYEDGEHSVMCDECDFEYEISTYVKYTFKSPERLKDE